MKHITDGYKKLYTQRELCEIWNISEQQFDRRKQKYEWKPIEGKSTGGRPALLYDKETCEELERLFLGKEEESRKSLIVNKVNNLPETVKGAVMTLEIEKLDADDSDEGIKACMTNAAGFMAMLNRKIERLNDKNKALSEKVQKLECELDIASDKMTCETYALRVLGRPIQRKTAAKITRRLHREGYEDSGKVPSKADPNMFATLWSTKCLDFANAQRWFNEYE